MLICYRFIDCKDYYYVCIGYKFSWVVQTMEKFNQLEYIAKYQQEHYKKIGFRLSYEKDQDIISWLDTIDNKQAYLKELIRNDIKNSNK